MNAPQRKPINSRAKGAVFERTIAARLEGLTGISFKRNLEQVRAVDHCDLLPSDPAWPFSLELKRYATGTGCKPEWRRQAERAAEKTGLIPAVVYQFDRRDVFVSVPLAAIGKALGQDWPETGWAEITLEGLAYVAGELMAGARE
jgi:hypothetical protein